jgi:predicted ATP-grasp superfamily ATP-dependent carboligase
VTALTAGFLLGRLPSASPAKSVLLLGSFPTITMAVARSLHRRGVRVVMATIVPGETPLRSRAIAAFFALPSPDRPAEEFCAALRRLIEEQSVELVLPLTDRALARVAPHLERLRPFVRFAGPSAASISVVLDKEATARAAAEVGVPMPAIVAMPPPEGDRADFESLNYPLFAKCRDRRTDDGLLPRRINDAAALRALAADPAGREKYLLQEFFSGEDVGLAVLIQGGRRVAAFQYRAAKTWPAEGGICVLARTEAVDPRLLACAERLLRALEWEGIAQVDFRHDRATGRFALLEINARFWGTTGVAVAAGVDFPRYVWEIARGETPRVPPGYRTGLRVRSIEGDFRRLLGLVRMRASDTGFKLWRELLRFVADTRPGIRGLCWSWRDPWPAFQIAWNLGRWWLLARWRNATAAIR